MMKKTTKKVPKIPRKAPLGFTNVAAKPKPRPIPRQRPARGNALFLRMSDACREAVEEYIAQLNAAREAEGLPRQAKSQWAHDVLMLAIGRADLTLAGQVSLGDAVEDRVRKARAQ